MPNEPGTTGVQNGVPYTVYNGSIQSGGDRNWRNNNPGNLEAGAFSTSHGAIGSDGRFAIFPTAESGAQALQSLLQTNTYQSLSVGDAIARFAPANENDTAAYSQFIQDHVGETTTTPMSRLTPGQLNSAMSAINAFEGG